MCQLRQQKCQQGRYVHVTHTHTHTHTILNMYTSCTSHSFLPTHTYSTHTAHPNQQVCPGIYRSCYCSCRNSSEWSGYYSNIIVFMMHTYLYNMSCTFLGRSEFTVGTSQAFLSHKEDDSSTLYPFPCRV